VNLNGWKERLFQRYLAWNCRSAKIRSYLRAILPSLPLPGPVDRRRVRVAALQIKLELCQSPIAFANLIHRQVKEAYEAGARLVVFPEYLNLLLFGMLPGIEKIEKDYSTGTVSTAKNDQGGQNDGISLPDLFRFMTPAVQPLINTIFSALAASYHLFIMAGSYTLAVNGAIVNRACLHGPEGGLVGYQDKVHLLPVEEKWGLKRGDKFKVFDTAIGRLAMPVCMDATYFETFRILEKKDVEIVTLPIANLEAYNYWLALRGIWPRVQECALFGVKSALVGSIAGLTFTGRAGVFAPIELTASRDGVLAEADCFDNEALAVADLNLDALKELRRDHPWRDRNPALYGRYFPQIYRG